MLVRWHYLFSRRKSTILHIKPVNVNIVALVDTGGALNQIHIQI